MNENFRSTACKVCRNEKHIKFYKRLSSLPLYEEMKSGVRFQALFVKLIVGHLDNWSHHIRSVRIQKDFFTMQNQPWSRSQKSY